ncbi:hypothetical protein ADICEAN_04085 [Cesiribacter andamanensis AMV16]|uniref:Uncharacterized protein n=1 Tax=Cesiribacter andamanensis AMV16 TaxID=1279009 RepID=M7N0R2_9BACT|nr:hypothetical protein ADICEAN_04085 [Cesiribacter andamanensis AMV16]
MLGIFAQAGAAAVGANGAAPVAAQQHAVLHLVQLGVYPLKEAVDPLKIAVAIPEQLLLLRRKLVVGAVDGKIEADAVAQQGLQPVFALALAAPGGNGPFIYAQAFVGNNQVGINAQHLPKALAGFAGAIGVIKSKEVYAGFLKLNAIQLKAVGEGMAAGLGTIADHLN